MRTLTIVLMVPMLAVACGGGGGGGDTSGQPDVPQADPGPTPDPGTPDPGTPDTGTPDSGPVDPGPEDTPAPDDPGPTDPGPTPDTALPDIPAQCPTVVTGPTCAAKVACALQCADATYGAACVGTAAGQATQSAQAALACLKGLDCGPVIEDEGFSDCASAACENELDACFEGTGICNDIRKCRMACEPTDPACPLRCRVEATLEEQDVWDTYRDCIMGADCVQNGDVMPNGWPTENCERYAQMHYCPLQTQACIPPQ